MQAFFAKKFIFMVSVPGTGNNTRKPLGMRRGFCIFVRTARAPGRGFSLAKQEVS